MRPAEPDDPSNVYLAAYHDALLAGQEPPTAPPGTTADLAGLADCLRRLDDDRRQTTAEPAPLGGRIGRFELRRELGRGSYGVVFLATDTNLRRDVALKVPHLRTLVSPDLRQRFQREARAAAALEHPGIVPVYEAGEADGVCYIASAYCAGPTLSAWLRQQPSLVAPQTAAALVADLADAVQHAHDRGVLHRDLKPANVLLVSGGVVSGESSQDTTHHSPLTTHQPKVTDFGLAKLLDGEDESTRTGAVLGTPSYMTPEQAEGQLDRVGPAADVYGLGAILYELLTERPPFKGATPLTTLEQVRTETPLPPSRLHTGLPRDLETICLKCLQKDPADRYASAAELRDDLRRFQAGEPIRARPARLWTRFRLWSRRPERIRDAGGLMMAQGLVYALYCVAALLFLMVGWMQSPHLGYTVVYGLVSLFGIHLPSAILGWRTMQGSRVALGCGTLVNLFLAVLAVYGVVHGMDQGWGTINRDELMLINLCILVVAWVVFAADVLAIRATLFKAQAAAAFAAGNPGQPGGAAGE